MRTTWTRLSPEKPTTAQYRKMLKRWGSLILSILGKILRRQHFNIFFFLFFPENRICHFMQTETICKKSCFLRKIRKYHEFVVCLIAQIVVYVRNTWNTCCFFFLFFFFFVFFLFCFLAILTRETIFVTCLFPVNQSPSETEYTQNGKNLLPNGSKRNDTSEAMTTPLNEIEFSFFFVVFNLLMLNIRALACCSHL